MGVCMENQHARLFSRRTFLRGIDARGHRWPVRLACHRTDCCTAAGDDNYRVKEGPFPCEATVLVAQELLRAEGFSDV
jgi:hypothetical protein